MPILYDSLRTIRGLIALMVCWYLASPVEGSFKSEMELLAMHIAETLQLTPQSEVTVQVIETDQQSLLPLSAFFHVLEPFLRPYSQRCAFVAYTGSLPFTPLCGTFPTSKGRGGNQVQGTSILYGCVYLIQTQSLVPRIHISITLCSDNGTVLLTSPEFVLNRNDCPAGILREIVLPLDNQDAFQRVQFTAELVKKMDVATAAATDFNHGFFTLINRFPTAPAWQIDALIEAVSTKYAITLSDSSQKRLTIEPSGNLTVQTGTGTITVKEAIDGQPLMPFDFVNETDSLYYLYPGDENSPSENLSPMEKKAIHTDGEKKIRAAITSIFHNDYPALFNPFNSVKLRNIFATAIDSAILVGAKISSDAASGQEVVSYRWLPASVWISNLEHSATQLQRTFFVTTKVIGLFNDNLDPHRYWAIVQQRWTTKSKTGRTLYQDDGFLIVNFDFTPQYALKQFHIYYRLWFYNYQYAAAEQGLSRSDKIGRDLSRHFVNGMGGIDTSLKASMRDFILQHVAKTVRLQ